MSDFPRGWTLSNGLGVAGGTASVTAPAIAGIVHVLDSFTAYLLNPTAAGAATIILNSSDGVFTNFTLAIIEAGAAPSLGTASGSGLDLAAGPGASLTIAFNAGLAGANQTIVAQGHDI